MRVATFNLLHGRSLSDGLVDLGRLREACASIDADVLGLQEVDRDQTRSDGHDLTKEIADATGAEYWRFEPALVGTPGFDWRAAVDGDYLVGTGEAGYGVGLVSRWPVSRWEVIRLPAAKLKSPIMIPGTKKVIWLQDEPRVALCAVVESPIGTMTVATTHLSFVPIVNARQLRTVVREMRRLLPPPYVLAGDLNMIGGFPKLVSGWRSLANAKTYPTHNPSVQFDWILADGDLPPVTGTHALALPMSDHRALAVDLEQP